MVLAGCTQGRTADEGEQLHGSGTQTQLNSCLAQALSSCAAPLRVAVNSNSIRMRPAGGDRPLGACSLCTHQRQQKLLEGKAGSRKTNCLAVCRWEREKGTVSEAHSTRVSWTRDRQ